MQLTGVANEKRQHHDRDMEEMDAELMITCARRFASSRRA